MVNPDTHMNAITNPFHETWSPCRPQLLARAILAAALLLPVSLRAQNADWMLFSPKDTGVPTAGIMHLAVSPNGDIWTGCTDTSSLTSYGVARFDGQKWTVYNTSNSGLPSNAAYPFAFDKLGNAWIGTINFFGADGGSGLVKLNGTNWTAYTMRNSGLPSDNIWAGTIDPQGNIWLATGAGVVRFDGTSWTVFSNNDIGLQKNWFSAIAADSKGNIWAATYESAGGVAKFDGQTWTAYTRANSGITDDAILNIVFDSQGCTWFGSIDYYLPAGALVKFDSQNWTTYTTENSKLPGGWGLTVDSQGMIWAGGGGILFYIGDNTGGVGKFDGQTWTVYKKGDSGMPARKVWALAQDSYGNMWMGTESGLVAYRDGGVVFPAVTPVLTLNAAVGKAIDAHDTNGIVGYMAADAVFDFVSAPPALTGTNAIGGFFAGLFHGFPDYATIAEQRWVSGNTVVTAHTTTGTLQNAWMRLPATGKGSIPNLHLDIWEYQGDKIQRITTYTELQSLMVSVGLMPAPQLPPLQPTTAIPDPVPTELDPVAAVIESQARWNAHDVAGLARMMRTDAQVLFAMLGVPLDRKAFAAMEELYFLAFRDQRMDAVRHLDLGNGWVLSEVVFRGINDGPYFGLPATGRSVNVRGAIVYQVDGQGLLTTMKIYFDNLTTLTQLGLFPPPLTAEELQALNTGVGKAIDAHDTNSIVSYMASDVVFDFVSAPPALTGTNAIAGFFAGLFHGFPDYATIAEQRWVSGNIVVTAHTTTGTLQNAWMSLPPTGKGSIPNLHLDIWEYQGDKIQRITTYTELQSLMVSVGLMPASQLPALQPATPIPDPVPTGLTPVAAVIESQARWNAHDVAGLAKMMRTDTQVLFAMLGVPLDRKAFAAMAELYFLAFRDQRMDIVRHLDLGNGWVLSEVVFRGINDGPYFGLPATGRSVNVRGAIVYQVDGQGLLATMKIYFDNLTTLTQLGLFPPALPKNLIVAEITSPSLAGNKFDDPTVRKMLVYLPPSYTSSPERRYPVVYFLHGYSGDYTYFTPAGTASMLAQILGQLDIKMDIGSVADGLITSGQMEEMILVMPDAFNAYGGSWYERSPVIGDYRNYIARDLVAYVDGNYRTIVAPGSRGIAGHSMGGHGALSLTMEFPEVFGAVAALSPGDLNDLTVPSPYLSPENFFAENPEAMGYPVLIATKDNQKINPSGLPATVITKDQTLSYLNRQNTMVFYSVAAALSPNLDNPPYYADLPLKYPEKAVIPEKWEAWKQRDLVHQIAQRGENLVGKPIYVDQGTGKVVIMPEVAGVERVLAALGAKGILCTYETFDGDHFTHLRHQTEAALKFMSKNLVLFPPPQLSFQRTATGVTITYQGTLLSAPLVSGPWSSVAGAASPYTVAANSGQMFFKAQK